MRVALTLVASVLLHAAVAFAAIIECTPTEYQAFEQLKTQLLPAKCTIQDEFDACDDDCYAAKVAIHDKTPNCTVKGRAEIDVGKCEAMRPLPRSVYMPKVGTGLVNCTSDQTKAAIAARNQVLDCWKVNSFGNCTDECVKQLEQAVEKQPLCAHASGYGSGEITKIGLARCLRARKEKITENIVMMTVLNGDGSKTVATNATGATPSTTQPPPGAQAVPATQAPAASHSASVLVSALVMSGVALLSLANA